MNERDRDRELEASRASDLRSRTILESITDGYLTLDAQWRFDYVNPEAERILGREPGALLGKVIWDEYPGTVGTEFEHTYRRVAAERRPESFLAFYADHGRWYDVRAFPLPTGLTIYFRDVSEAKQVAALRASEERRRLALDSAELGAWNIDPPNKLLTCDERFSTIFTGASTPLDYEQAVAAVHVDDRSTVGAAIAAAIRPHDPIPYAIEYRVVHPDGAVRWVFAKGRANFSADGPDRRLASFDGTVADITERKQAEDRLRVSEARFRTLFESIDEGFCVVEVMFDTAGKAVDYRYLEANPAFERHTGLHGVVGKTVREFVPDMDQFWFEMFGRVATTGQPTRFMSEAKALQSRWFDVYAFRLGKAEDRRVAILINDITARRRAEERLREAEEQFRTLADNMAQFAWTADADGAINWYNRRWYDYTGTTLETMQGWGWQAVHHPDHLDRVVERFKRFLASGEPWEDTFPLRGRDGGYRWFLSRALPIRNESGTLLRWFGTNTDVTEQRETAEELRQVAAELSQADRRKDEFLATLAHELRNPLAPIRNSLEIIRVAASDPVAVERARRIMERQLVQMTRLVDDLLDVSRISSDKLVLRRERIDLATVVHSAVETSRPVLDAAGQQLTVTLPAEPVLLDADLTRLAQVFMNLLNNAAKFSEPGGRVALTAERDGDEVVVTVTDTGVGIPADHLGGIFQMFFQVDASLDRSLGGLGIGLTLVRRLVELHGGRVAARSDGPGTGSEFTVHLPAPPTLATVLVAAVPVAADDAARSACGLRVLVVDDNRDAATSLAALLQLMDNEAHTAFDGVAAFEAAAKLRPDVILLDIGLPGLNGYEVARRIRAETWGRDVRLFAMTGWGQDGDKRKSQAAGFDQHLVKPVDLAVLACLLSEPEAPPT